MYEKKLLAISAIIASAVALVVVFSMTAQPPDNVSAAGSACNPDTLASVQNSAFSTAKLPASTSLPLGYELQAVDDAYQIVSLYYSDHDICTPSPLVDELSNGTVIIQISEHPDLVDEDKLAIETAGNLEKATNGLVKPQILNIGKHKAIAWDQYEGKNIIMTDDGKILEEEQMPMPARVTIFDAEGDKEYSMAANKPLEVLLSMAKTIDLG